MTQPLTIDRWSTAGLAHSAADHITETTGVRHVMAFRPRTPHPDRRPFVVVPEETTR